jgi:hypothetical protein
MELAHRYLETNGIRLRILQAGRIEEQNPCHVVARLSRILGWVATIHETG